MVINNSLLLITEGQLITALTKLHILNISTIAFTTCLQVKFNLVSSRQNYCLRELLVFGKIQCKTSLLYIAHTLVWYPSTHCLSLKLDDFKLNSTFKKQIPN